MDKELLTIILGTAICCAFYYLGVYKRNKEIKKQQERLNEIKTDWGTSYSKGVPSFGQVRTKNCNTWKSFREPCKMHWRNER